MMRWTILCAVIALVSAAIGFGDIASGIGITEVDPAAQALAQSAFMVSSLALLVLAFFRYVTGETNY